LTHSFGNGAEVPDLLFHVQYLDLDIPLALAHSTVDGLDLPGELCGKDPHIGAIHEAGSTLIQCAHGCWLCGIEQWCDLHLHVIPLHRQCSEGHEPRQDTKERYEERERDNVFDILNSTAQIILREHDD
jgi:hypothetical protein